MAEIYDILPFGVGNTGLHQRNGNSRSVVEFTVIEGGNMYTVN